MIKQVCNTLSNWEHFRHPLDASQGLNNQSPIWKRIVTVAALILISIPTLGLPLLFYTATAIWKHKQVRVVAEKNTQKNLISAEEYNQTYQLEDTIEKIKKLSATHKLCLFVGRNPSEALPSPKANEVWVSLDVLDAIANTRVSPDRLHLKINMNDQAKMNLISKLFDKVVLDRSVLKFVPSTNESRWITLGKLLKDQPESELIAEAWTGIATVPRPGDNVEEGVSGDFCIPFDDYLAAKNEKERESLRNSCMQRALNKMLSHLRTLFTHVIYNKDQPYETKGSDKCSYFVLNGPTKAVFVN
jgi:hypothetical protein